MGSEQLTLIGWWRTCCCYNVTTAAAAAAVRLNQNVFYTHFVFIASCELKCACATWRLAVWCLDRRLFYGRGVDIPMIAHSRRSTFHVFGEKALLRYYIPGTSYIYDFEQVSCTRSSLSRNSHRMVRLVQQNNTNVAIYLVGHAWTGIKSPPPPIDLHRNWAET